MRGVFAVTCGCSTLFRVVAFGLWAACLRAQVGAACCSGLRVLGVGCVFAVTGGCGMPFRVDGFRVVGGMFAVTGGCGMQFRL